MRAFPITEGEGRIAGEAVSGKAIIGLAEHVNRCTCIANQEESIEAFDALAAIVVGVAVLHLELSIHL